MGVPPIPKCQHSLPQINLLQTVFVFCYCAELVILYDRAGGEGSQGKSLDLRWQENFESVPGNVFVVEKTGCGVMGTVKNQVAYEADSR